MRESNAQKFMFIKVLKKARIKIGKEVCSMRAKITYLPANITQEFCKPRLNANFWIKSTSPESRNHTTTESDDKLTDKNRSILFKSIPVEYFVLLSFCHVNKSRCLIMRRKDAAKSKCVE